MRVAPSSILQRRRRSSPATAASLQWPWKAEQAAREHVSPAAVKATACASSRWIREAAEEPSPDVRKLVSGGAGAFSSVNGEAQTPSVVVARAEGIPSRPAVLTCPWPAVAWVFFLPTPSKSAAGDRPPSQCGRRWQPGPPPSRWRRCRRQGSRGLGLRRRLTDRRHFFLILDRKSTRLNSSHITRSRMPSSA